MRSALAFCAGPAALSGFVPVPVLETPKLAPGPTWMILARRALAAGDPSGALRAFDGVLAHEPRNALAHLGRAVCLTQLARDDEAEDAVSATLEASVGQEEVLYQLARMCAREGQTSLAIPLLTEALRAKPVLVDVAQQEPMFRDHPAYLAAVGAL